MKIVIIGGTAAGTSAAAKAKRVDAAHEVVLLEKSPHLSVGACGIPYALAGITDLENLVARSPQKFMEQGVDVRIQHEGITINAENKILEIYDHSTKKSYQENYDKLVIATGARAIRPDIPGVQLKNVFTVRGMADALELSRVLPTAKHAVIIGAGYLGLELVETCVSLNIPVTLVQKSKRVLSDFGEAFSEQALAELERNNVKLLTETEVQGLEGSSQVTQVVTSQGRLEADVVVFGIGVTPNSELAAKAGVKLGVANSIHVGEFMQTNLEHIYAAGDVADVFHRVSKRQEYIPIGTTANKQGRVAGANAAGKQDTFEGVVGTAILKIFELGFARTGLTLGQAQSLGFNATSAFIQSKDRAGYYPGAKTISVEIIYDTTTDKLLGANLSGDVESVKRVDTVAALLHMEATVDDLARLDLAYAPPFATVWDALLVAANQARKD
jgi:NADPH-dependent 2,4-dienoyl-CoA reductase/sulfur reductase-like enzyme